MTAHPTGTREPRQHRRGYVLPILCLVAALVAVGCGSRGFASLTTNDASNAGAKSQGVSAQEQARDSDFQTRCQAPGVVRCFDFDASSEVQKYLMAAWDGTYRGQVVTDVKASGTGSLRFEIPPHSPANTSGLFWLNFSDDLGIQFGEGSDFYIQWRQRFSPEFLKTYFEGGEGWKQIIIGEGDRPGFSAGSCTQLEIVVQNSNQHGFPQMYHSCGMKDGSYEPLTPWDDALRNYALQNAVGCPYGRISFPPCVGYKANQWMTFQVEIRVGTWYKNDGKHRGDSTVRLWVAEEGKPSKLVIDYNPKIGPGYDIANTNPPAKYGKLWLLLYNTHKDPAQEHPVGYSWYDELIISRSRIPDPKPVK